jgi:hypothetical protein
MADTNGKTASKTSSILTSAPSSYAYTSSASLLRGDGAKGRGIAVPPPTLPKYAGVSSGYRLASLERLANRQRLYEHNNGTNGSTVGAAAPAAPVIETNGTANVSTQTSVESAIFQPGKVGHLSTGNFSGVVAAFHFFTVTCVRCCCQFIFVGCRRFASSVIYSFLEFFAFKLYQSTQSVVGRWLPFLANHHSSRRESHV